MENLYVLGTKDKEIYKERKIICRKLLKRQI